MNKKKLLLIVTVIGLLFLMSGCSIPTDENGKYVLIALNEIQNTDRVVITSFSEMMSTEGFFSALFVYPLSQFINFFTPYTNVGIAILVVTVIINVVLLLFTFKQNVAMQKMQTLQPEIDKINRKYEGKTDEASKMRMAQEMQNLYAKNNINPFSSLLTTFIQFPILIAMYHAVQRAYSVAYGTFMGISLENTPLQGVRNGEWIYAVFFALMIVAQFGSMMLPQMLSKYRAKKAAEKAHKPYRPASNPANSTMYMMMIFITVIAVGWPTAMSFYWMISSLVNIVKTLLVDYISNRGKE